MHLSVARRSTRADLEPRVLAHTRPGGTVHTDEWGAYNHLAESNREHATVNHGQREWARDEDGDGVREVHCNTMEGCWTGLRNFLRTFRGVSKKYLQQYAAIHEWAFRLKAATAPFLRTLLGAYTTKPT